MNGLRAFMEQGRSTAARLREPVARWAWFLFLVSLPVTSFPYFPGEIGGGTLVRPLAIYPLLVLLVLVVVPRLLTRPLPRTLLSLFPFVLVAVASTLLATLYGVEASQGISVTARMARALATLGLGVSIYLAIVLWPQNQEDLRISLRWLYIGFGVALFWGGLQAIYVLHFSPRWFEWLSQAQEYISIRRLFPNRVSGLTYEPNWFADQLAFLLLPWLMSAILSGYTVFSWRWRWITIELVMLGWMVAVIPFTYSRAGLLILLAVILAGVLFFRARHKTPVTDKQTRAPLPLRRVAEGTLLVVFLAGIIYSTGTRNAFFARIWDYWGRRPDEGYARYLAGYFEYLGFGARFTYWETAYRTFESHPVLGVGLGNYAFYFEENLPERALAAMPEVLRQIVPEEGRNRLVTSKNFYFRVLAETGLVGAAVFLAFLAAILGCALYLWFSQGQEARFWGTGGLLGVLAFVLAAFSFDSLALPNMWVVFGFITAAAHRYSQP